MGSERKDSSKRRALTLWLLVLLLGAATWWLGQLFWELRVVRVVGRMGEGVRQTRESCELLAGGCLMDPLLLLGDESAESVLNQVKGGRTDWMNGPPLEALIHWLMRDGCLATLVAGLDGDPTTVDIPANLSRPLPGLDTVIEMLESIVAHPESSVGVRRAALAGLNRCAPDHAARAHERLETSQQAELFAGSWWDFRRSGLLALHERSELAALLRLPHECLWSAP